MMSQKRRIPLDKEDLIQRWQRYCTHQNHLTFQEFLQLLHQHVRIKFLRELISMKFDRLLLQVLLETFFYIFDRDSSGLLSESEWIGSVYKVTEYRNRY